MAGLEGQTFAGYEIVAKLGEGGMGAVWKARQPMLNRLVALKMMSPSLSGDPAFVARFIREASAAANLNHPNMVQVYTAGESDKIYYIAMEFVEGESLRIRLDRMGRIPPQETVAITVYVAQALQYAWNKARLIHRDIKPDNVFLSNAGEVKVGDLGLAKSVGGETTDVTQTGTVMGSPHYISPEQAQGAKDIDFRADIYSLGCTLYHMLTGKTPYEGDSSMAIIMKHVHEPAPAIFRTWPACPMPLGRLVGKMVAKRRQERHQSYEDLLADLMQVHEKLRQSESIAPVATTPAPAVADTVPRARQTDAAVTTQAKAGNKKLVFAAAGTCAAVALAGLLWWSPWKAGEEPRGKGQAVSGSESRLQAESVPTQPAKAGTPTAAPAEPPRQETVAAVTPLAPATPPAADSALRIPPSAIPVAAAPFDAAQARQHQEAWARHLGVPVEMTNSIGMKFVLIPPGEFDMGSSVEAVAFELEEGRRTKPPVHKFYIDRVLTEKPQRRVKITKPFYLSVCEVTQTEYQTVTGGNPSAFSATGNRKNVSQIAGADTSRHPVEMVSWDEAKQFLDRMASLPAESSARRSYRLPTEAEWEHACRAGTTTRWWFGDESASLPPCAWFKENSGGATHPVGKTRPNPWGLFDMPGNVFEWCSDRCNEGAYDLSETTDPQGPTDGHFHITRGGCYERYALSTRSAYRGVAGGSPWPVRSDFMGFRVACEIAAKNPPTLAAPSPIQPPSPTTPAVQTADGFQPLFNGRDLNGWVPMKTVDPNNSEHQPTTGGWNVRDGELVCATSENGWLKTERQYGDYMLQLEFKLLRNSNSDVYIRFPESGRVGRAGMDIQIIDPNYRDQQLPPEKQTGAIYDVVGSPQPPVRPPGEWNSMEIRCEGDNVEVTLNGTRTAAANMNQHPALRDLPRSGYIGIGNWHGQANGMTFRNIRIKELGAAAAGSVAASSPPSNVTAVSQNVINLMPLIDPQKDAVKGDWKMTTDGLLLEKPAGHVVLDLPYSPPEEYDFEIEFTPKSNGKNVNQYLIAAGHSFAWKVARNDQYAVIELMDGKYYNQRKEGVSEKTLFLEIGRRYVSKVEVRRGSLRALVNGEEYLRWSGDFNRLSLETVFKLHDDRHIGVGSVQRGVVFHRIEVREVTGKGTLTRVAPTGTQSTALDSRLSAFCNEVAALPPVQQVARVVAKLKELNAGFDGKETHKVEGGSVTELAFSTVGVTNISPVSALKQLKKLTVAPWATNQKGSLADLSPLKELPLAWLYCQNNPISDLSPLKSLPLTVLSCGGTQVTELSPLAGMKLTVLSINGTSVSDLSPLSGMPLTVLWCNSTWVADFAALKGLPLQELRCDFQPQRDTDALRDIPTLRKINDQPAAVLLRQPATSTQAPRTSALGGDIRVLIVTGVDLGAHDWRSTGPAIRNELQKDSRMKVEILNDIYRLDSMDLTKFQVVLLNFYTKDKPDPNEQARNNLKNFVNRGGGLVVFHCTCGSFRDWPEFRDLAGKIMNLQKGGHDSLGPMRVKITNPNHPITRGMQAYETTDELYAFLAGRKPVEVLATARAKSTGSDEPMAFVLNYGKGRVFHFVLGHDVRAIETPGTAELLRRGTAWTAGREPAPLAAATKR